MAASVGTFGSMFSQEIGILTELNPHAATFVKDVGGMLHPFPHESGELAGFPVPKSRPSTSTPTSGTTFPAASKTLVLPASVCNQPVTIGAQGADVQSGFAREVDVVTDAVGIVEVPVVVVVARLELEVTLVADEELVLPDSVVLAADEVCCLGIIITSVSAPATTNAVMKIKTAIRTFDRARVCGATVPICDSFPCLSVRQRPSPNLCLLPEATFSGVEAI